MITSDLNNSTLNSAYSTVFLTTSRGKRCIALLGEMRSLAMLELAFTCVASEFSYLNASKKYKARELCNEGIWLQLTKSEITSAGICLAYFADAGALPLRMHKTPSGKGPKSYWIY